MKSDTALLLIDIQDSFKTGTRWERRGNHAFERNVTTLLDAFRAADLPRFFILHTDTTPGFTAADPEHRLMDFMERRDDEPLLVKTTRNSFTSTNLKEQLDHLGIKRLVITGIQTEQCCETTARVAADVYEYHVDFVTEATQTFPILDRESGEELMPDEIFRRTEFVLRDRFARIVRASKLVAELKGALPSTR